MLMDGGRWSSAEMCGGCYAYFDEDLLGSEESPFRYFTSIEDVPFGLWEDTEWAKIDG